VREGGLPDDQIGAPGGDRDGAERLEIGNRGVLLRGRTHPLVDPPVESGNEAQRPLGLDGVRQIQDALQAGGDRRLEARQVEMQAGAAVGISGAHRQNPSQSWWARSRS
jgi:hypothetical protein